EARATVEEIEALGRRAVALQADLTQVGQIKSLVTAIEQEFGRLDALVNSAANFIRVPLEEINESVYDLSLDTNLKGPTFCALEAARLIRATGGGKIVNFADWAGFRPYKNYLPYLLAKGGIITLTKALALELAPEIAVNAVAPGPVLPPPDTTEEFKAMMIRQVPLKRLGSPEDIVATVAVVLEGSDYITGQVICVDGGRLIANSA
ncbi:MAG: SDR family oxidoreductase, partial [Desulfobacterales bacterium]|nr:SDR family oxidoreductase [Desulfobacterales bacterium]